MTLNVEPLDPRDTSVRVLGTLLRDAAVDPQAVDFLPPLNAGEVGTSGNPHGSNVVAPGIHANGDRPPVPGPVGTPAEQEIAETAAAATHYGVDNS
jgi:hypothetical protein